MRLPDHDRDGLSLKYKLNVDNLDHVAGKTLELNEVGSCNITTAKAVVFDPYADNGDTARSF